MKEQDFQRIHPQITQILFLFFNLRESQTTDDHSKLREGDYIWVERFLI